METETVIAIGIGIIALFACFGVYQMIPEEVDNPVTWGAITQYNDEIKAIQTDVAQLKIDVKYPKSSYDEDLLDDIRDDIDDLEDEIDDIDDGDDWYDMSKKEYKCLMNSTGYSNFQDCLDDI